MTGVCGIVESLQHPLDAATSRPAEVLLLFLLPFVREDVAVVTGSLLIVEHRLPLGLALASLYADIAPAISCSSALAGRRAGAPGPGGCCSARAPSASVDGCGSTWLRR